MAIDHEGTITRGFLFADLRGYTAFVEQRGAAAAAELLTRYRALAREAIGRFGGAEIKTEGDSFYVVFDSVSSAVRCGLAIIADVQGASGEAIRVGVGVHAGETIEADGGYVGSPVNIAARICAQAGPGEVLVSETVRALTMTLLPVQFKSRGRRQLKGIAEPIQLFAVEEATAGATAWASTRRRRLSRRARAGLAGSAVIVVAAAAGIGWLALQPSTGLPSGPWTIGVHVPTSGPSAAEGIAVRNAVQLAIDKAKTNGAVGTGVELILKAHDTGDDDDGEDPARGAAAARKMAGDPRTIAAIGPFTSPTAGETIPITNRAGLLECSPSNSYQGLTKPEYGALEFRAAQPERINYVRLSPTVDVSARALAAFATHELDAESALVVADPEWQDLAADFTKAFTALGGQVAQRKLAPGTSPAAALAPLRGKAPPDVVAFAGSTDSRAADVRRAMRKAGYGSTPFVSWDGILDGSGAIAGSYLQRAGKAAAGTVAGLTAIAPPRADFVDAYRSAFGEEPTDHAAAAYACAQVILASLEAVAEDGPDADELREALRARAVDPAHRYETVLGTLGFDANGDSTQQMVSFFRVDPEAADGAGDWALIKQQDFGLPS
ncbi:MAG: ABC transporter substrate-binding protein [Actinomycetota bacterium]|nr:ABC transporter substrate-binding protein [Actinomycetota bacterium]